MAHHCFDVELALALLARGFTRAIGTGLPMSSALIIFAKAPIAGLAKTRLIPALGPQGAAALAEKMLGHAVGQALASGCETVELCVTPDTNHPAFAHLVAQSGGRMLLSEQGSGDLGQRMDRAITRALQNHGRALLMGSDAPGLDANVLRTANVSLNNYDAVFVPARDGGYALVGLTQPRPDFFVDMVWSTPFVMAHTRARMQAADFRWAELDPLDDIDEPTDLACIPSGWLV